MFPASDEVLLLEAMNKVCCEHTPPAVDGSFLLSQIEKKTRFLPFGCASLDALLEGGLREGQVLELYGDSGSGKTQLCLSACAQTIARGERVLYIDTSNAFTATRLLSILKESIPNFEMVGTAHPNYIIFFAFKVSSGPVNTQEYSWGRCFLIRV